MKLYNYWRSSCSWRVRIGLAIKKIPYEYVAVHLVRGGGEQHQPGYHERNPMEQVPVLEVTDKGKTICLGQSTAILEYLEETHPEPALLPKDPIRRAQTRQLVEIVNSGIQPFQGLRIFSMITDKYKGDKAEWVQNWIGGGLAALEEQTKRTAGKYSVGDQITMADLFLVPQMFASRRFGIDTARFSTLTAVENRCLELDAFKTSHPERQPDSEKA